MRNLAPYFLLTALRRPEETLLCLRGNNSKDFLFFSKSQWHHYHILVINSTWHQHIHRIAPSPPSGRCERPIQPNPSSSAFQRQLLIRWLPLAAPTVREAFFQGPFRPFQAFTEAHDVPFTLILWFHWKQSRSSSWPVVAPWLVKAV